MHRRGLLLLVLLLAGCGGHEGPRAVIETDEGTVTVAVEIADEPAERARGLMNRTSLPPDTGMMFLFPKDTDSAFWMKNTLIPLSIAFYEADGRIVRILEMTPCRADPCRLYSPGAAYRGALEANRGAFARWEVSVGDVLHLER
jgi:uncharacterized membrane protein (UPF0127 family)